MVKTTRLPLVGAMSPAFLSVLSLGKLLVHLVSATLKPSIPKIERLAMSRD